MPDWTQSMQQTFEYYIVDPFTWKDSKKITNVTGCSITRDLDVETLGSATFDIVDSLGEQYVRAYLVTLQNGITEKHPLGTYLVQTPTTNYNGVIRTVSMDAYTPLLELKESIPPLGYSKLKGDNIMLTACQLVREYTRAPVVEVHSNKTLHSNFTSNTNDTWLLFISDLIASANFTFDLDGLGRVLFSPKQELASLQPVWTFNDDNSSILYPEVTMNHDLYGIPNVVEVVYSDGKDVYYSIAENIDANSPTSIVNRGRRIVHRITNPTLEGADDAPSIQRIFDEYAIRQLKEMSSVEYTITYTHGYCPVRVGDCVRLNYRRAGLNNVTAKVVSQTIKCTPGCPVQEKAVFTKKLWG